MSRSRFYQQAVESYLRRLTEEELTERMDAFVESHGQQLRESFEPYVKAAWAQELGDDEW